MDKLVKAVCLDNKCFRRFFCYNDFSNNEYDNGHRLMMGLRFNRGG
ncbi:hypothetical protein HMP0721_1856 [Pseudoramibacter alactolyticus ATCC 23263]|uniref:Uncharacterized protein n=1 Tax=Pseudoramibacter alactolyticus ATCC 23263 TaxID=887929 RepID=E6MIM1_9FIRM|nr:hypothetical protein HMP0721_1856 [Pseudoramibacter alactolyticus ATCC 23263]